jgi:hypothetical protein
MWRRRRQRSPAPGDRGLPNIHSKRKPSFAPGLLHAAGVTPRRRAYHNAWQPGVIDWDRMLLLLERFPLPRPRIVRRYAA